jgi:uncharacterized hydrophobic protein (TIGR00341 family)
MALRLIEMTLKKKDNSEVSRLLKKFNVIERIQIQLVNGEVLNRILLEAKQSEEVLDLLEKHCKENRILILPVEATLPRAEPNADTVLSQISKKAKRSERISREELYENIRDAAECSKVYLMMIVLSTIVASVGLQNNNTAIIIGSMVIAPLLGPNMALALGTTLGDLSMLRRAVLTIFFGIILTIIFSLIVGTFVHVDPVVAELASNMRVGMGNIAVALASGCAGALAFTTGVSAMLVGVMVAVSLLPPLVTFGLLISSGQPDLAMKALFLFMMNLICINLAGVTTFLVQGIRPTTWWEKNRASKAIIIAISLWVCLLTVLISVIILLRRDLI